VSAPSRAPALAPFRVRSFRFQWPADLATSWAFEMELLILGWYVLAESQSVFMLTVFASLLYIGTLLAPISGVIGDRIGNRNLLGAMRGLYTILASILMTLAFLEAVTPAVVLGIATVLGLVRPSDIGVRAALVGETMPGDHLMGAMSIQRTTLDSARIVGALTGAGLVATLGMGPAYVVVVSFYAASCLLTFQVDRAHPARHRAAIPGVAQRPSPWRDLWEGLAYVWNTPHLFGMMCLAFLVNVTAFPLFNSLMPYVAKEVYGADQTVLGYLVAGGAFGALTGSIALSRYGGDSRRARDDRVLRRLVRDAPRVRAYAASRLRHPGAPARRLRAKPRPGSDGSSAAAHFRPPFSRPHHGDPDAGDLRQSARTADLRSADRNLRLPGDGDALLRDRPGVHPAHRGALARPSLEARRADKRAVIPAPGLEFPRHERHRGRPGRNLRDRRARRARRGRAAAARAGRVCR
jgi:hypothetical protein